MKNSKISFGLSLTIIIFFISIVLGKLVKIPIDSIPPTFITHLTMLILTGFSIYYFQHKGILKIEIKRISVKLFLRIFLTIILAYILTNALFILIQILDMYGRVNYNPFLKFSPLQFFIYGLFLGSIVEELLFRGFLLNMLESLKSKTIQILRIKISFSVIIAGALFGLAHLVLLTSGAGSVFVFRVVFIATIMGVIAGYFQEKYENNILAAIIVHMTTNSFMMIGVLFLAMKK